MTRVTVRRLAEGSGATWVDAVELLVSEVDREGELIEREEAEEALVTDTCYMLVAEIESGGIVGLLSAYSFPDLECGGELVYLYDIEVREDLRGRGIGQSLVRALLAESSAAGVDLVWAGTDRDNAAARGAFERTGATTAGEAYVEYEWEP